jgi:hypothetical protein
MKHRPIFKIALAVVALFLVPSISLAQAQGSAPQQEAGQSPMADVARIFGHDPGPGTAYACFKRSYAKAHLEAHQQQNVTQMLLFVAKPAGDEMQFNLSMQVWFRKIGKPFEVAGGCSRGSEGDKALSCGIECDGGYLAVRIKNTQSILVDIPQSVRLWDPEADESDALPDKARFGADDKLFRLDRTDVKNCLPLIHDDEIRAEISR